MTPIPADIHRAARRRANELRDQAIDDLLRGLAARVRRALAARPVAPLQQAKPCRS